ncbi:MULTISPECIES: DUF732 domain-containing protein [Microbacterium]|uniref:DUF732 domain-containing protein n=1 Tax=Microbacterium algeriense TaxID=2615184 RepID=A0ABQ6V4Z4_9MICO|nr:MULTISPECIES: DUF732 domain-containing protein [Microbacterium]AZH78337.1 hypothetical protein CSX12_07605 [Microbacterium sp. Y-01]KAB1864458.1 hypothetical protein F6A08_10115 [Microbacterium algeriense]
MPKVTATTIAVTALLLVGLTGCTGTTPSAGNESTAPAASEPAPPHVTESPTAEPEASDAEAAFLALVGESLPVETIIPDVTDAQLLAAGQEACDRLRAGEVPDTMSLIEGEQKNDADIYADSSAIISSARLTLCTDQLSG